MAAKVDHQRVLRYHHARFELGLPRAEACRMASVSQSWGKSYDQGLPNHGQAFRDLKEGRSLPGGVVPRGELCAEALRALDDFGFFRRRYFGRVSSPWQELAAERVREKLESSHKEFVVINCPPGAGKSTFVHDLAAWLTVRNRALRGLLGSRTQRQANGYNGRLRRSFERVSLVQAKDDERLKGYAFDAEAVLARDFGPFKPENPDIWTREQFTVLQPEETPTDEKESTWTAFGMDAGSLGWRVNFIVWDDLVDKSTIRTAEAIESQRSWWEDEAETRLEPDGLLLLVGQRMSASDLYRHCLDMTLGDPDELEVPEGADEWLPRKYHHIVYKAHYDDRCVGVHRVVDGAVPFPEGCLLDPVRLPWRELRAIRANRANKFAVLYQQEDVDAGNVLVPKLWVDGGTDPVSHEVFPGCWDKDRGLCELPVGVTGPLLSVATADPSPTKFWSVQWWNVLRNLEAAQGEDVSGLRYLMDLLRQAMDAPDFLDWNHSSKSFSGVMEEWQQRSVDLGRPIQVWIVEANAAQRFMLQYDHVRRWCAARGVRVIAHQTHRNKTDPDYGVQMLAGPWRRGLVRLPGKNGDPGRPAALKLVDEVTRWPDGQYDDCVMGEWFLEHNLARLWATPVDAQPRLWRPSWARRGQAA